MRKESTPREEGKEQAKKQAMQDLIRGWHRNGHSYAATFNQELTLNKLGAYLNLENLENADADFVKQAEKVNKDKAIVKVECAGSGKIIFHEFQVNLNHTIADLKKELAKKVNAKEEICKLADFTKNTFHLHLGHGGSRLEDNTQTVKDAGIKSGSVLVFLPKSYKKVQKEVMKKLYALSRNPAVRDFDLNCPVEEWPGVEEVDEEGCITNINLDNHLITGSIPTEICNLTGLTKLYLTNNDLTGPIPTEIGNLKALTELDLTDNDLTGPIPTEIGKLTALKDLGLADTGLTGSIPTEIGKLTALEDLYLENSGLTGHIPTEIGNLTALNNELVLSYNQLTGTIPTEIGNLTRLTKLYLVGNQLTNVNVQGFKAFMKEQVPDCRVIL